ncbi:MAG TPA: DegT/DnrJ/EryC1/StrS family aminotransferase [Deltaproteobacteria bacterium]|nr:DegT/DnrJ/EryC1/StrS family aminotransferase [Deltaproteobacteria bacterium]HPP81498.1 DegT/DnrJ/EryC1/StrS family aminotransferase [Deltaproteobacteria bacterium]
MAEEFIPVSRPHIGDEEIGAVAEVLRSGWITTGQRCLEFERRFSELVGSRHAVALSSATAGMHLVLRDLGIGAGDEVITPSMTFASTVNQIVLAGARPVFADVDYNTLLVLPRDIERRITDKTRLIIPVHFAGAPADLDAISDAARGIPVLEDAAHAVGTLYKGRHVGSRNMALFSFHPIKNITTGEGGMLTCNDEETVKRVRLLRFHGIERDAWKRYGTAADPGYDIEEPGFKYNLTDLQAALGLAQLDRLSWVNARRGEIVRRYQEAFSGMEGIDLPGVPGYDHSHAWNIFVVKVTSVPLSTFMERLSGRNIGFGLHFPACHTLRYIQDRFGKADLPVTQALSGRILSLPLYPDMDDVRIERVIEAVRDALRSGG